MHPTLYARHGTRAKTGLVEEPRPVSTHERGRRQLGVAVSPSSTVRVLGKLGDDPQDDRIVVEVNGFGTLRSDPGSEILRAVHRARGNPVDEALVLQPRQEVEQHTHLFDDRALVALPHARVDEGLRAAIVHQPLNRCLLVSDRGDDIDDVPDLNVSRLPRVRVERRLLLHPSITELLELRRDLNALLNPGFEYTTR